MYEDVNMSKVKALHNDSGRPI